MKLLQIDGTDQIGSSGLSRYEGRSTVKHALVIENQPLADLEFERQAEFRIIDNLVKDV